MCTFETKIDPMKLLTFLLLIFTFFACNDKPKKIETKFSSIVKQKETNQSDFIAVFASCNDQKMEQPLWKPILETRPDVFVWGGDNIYADTKDTAKMKRDYALLLANPGYKKLTKQTKIIGTWDDHDYGINDGGKEWEIKADAQKFFLDFLKVPKESPRRNQEGVYTAEVFETPKGKIKIILLDTRYFRTGLKKSNVRGRRYEPWGKNHKGTILGEKQWEWLNKELQDTTTTFTVINSSIQVLSSEHGWERWATFPNELEKLKQTIKNAKSKNIFIISGDRHLAEFSVDKVEGLPYELVDFTTSGLTKTFPDNPDELNALRKGKQVKQLNFGVVYFNFEKQQVKMEIRGINNTLYETYTLDFKK